MNWLIARKAIIYVYATAFLLFGLLLIYSAYFGSRPWHFWLYFSAGLPFAAEGIGLYFFLWIARLVLKLALAFVAGFFLFAMVNHSAWSTLAISLAFAGLLFAELWFRTLDRQIATARRVARGV